MVQSLVQKKHPYLLQRSGHFYFRYVLPKRVASLCPELPPEIKRTLKTSSKLEAIYKINKKLPALLALAQAEDRATVCRLYAFLAESELITSQGVASFIVPPDQANQGYPLVGTSQALPQLPTLATVWADFVAWKQWNNKLLKNNERMFERLLHFLGNKPVDTITKQDIRLALGGISLLPRRNNQQFKRLSIDEVSKLSIDPENRLSSKSVKEHLKLCQGIFSSYLVKELGILSKSPTEGISVNHSDHRFGCLLDVQISELVEKSETKPQWFKWFLLLAIYTGARRSELSQLTTGDFKVCRDTGRDYFVINHSKTKAGRRVVPLHRSLVDRGFVSWLSNNEGHLFPVAFKNPNRVTEHFASLMVEHEDQMGQKIVFHSLRHTFITKVRASGISTPLVQQFVGHEKTGAGVTDRYTHDFAFKDLLKVLDVFQLECDGHCHEQGSGT